MDNAKAKKEPLSELIGQPTISEATMLTYNHDYNQLQQDWPEIKALSRKISEFIEQADVMNYVAVAALGTAFVHSLAQDLRPVTTVSSGIISDNPTHA